ncbi:SDR family oxidoreductase [Labedaea rhizosphaerae]|uniref:Uncharacterized protein YbjT (DUF2867 family) n=1 Tax=Labedaea rhizosphaerae TaxID=598644 RepID=A0A4R6SJN6_LABRH|nr:NAD(P)H-binding protein [Labedaea rhizosphaerae]TDQ01218.1 uncharacterized protein YbjT (DUF2867 family) [Labedaea rhizosphaerae]
MILVTGASGNVGRGVLARLPEPVRAMSRNPAFGEYGDLADPASLGSCLSGVDAVYLMWPFHDNADTAPDVVATIARHARRIVLLSSVSVEDGANEVGRTHAVVEDAVRASGLEWTIVRPSTFAANALWWADQIRAGDTVSGAFGALRMPMLHEADIADVVVHALTEDGHDGAIYRLTGPQALTQTEQVELIGAALGRPLRWHELTKTQARQRLLADPDFPDAFVDPLLDTQEQLLAEPPPHLTTTVENVTGQRPRTFAQWARDHVADFR